MVSPDPSLSSLLLTLLLIFFVCGKKKAEVMFLCLRLSPACYLMPGVRGRGRERNNNDDDDLEDEFLATAESARISDSWY